MKKIVLFLLAAVLTVLSGCANFLDAEYQASTPHVKKEDSSQTEVLPDSEVYIESGDVDDLSEAVFGLIRSQAEYGIIRITSYDGDIDADAEAVCLNAAYNTPYGAYAVYYVSFAVNKYVPFSEVKVYLTYKDGAMEYSDIPVVESTESVRFRLEEALRSFGGTFTIATSAPDIDTQYLLECVEEIYFAGNVWFPIMPAVTATSYPETGEERILELKLNYPYSNYRMNTMRTNTEEALAEMVARLEGLDEWDAVARLCDILSEECDYLGYGTTSDEYDRRSDKYTAYGALALGRASGEGYAMAVQLVCRELGIECIVVQGRHENVAHAWNIVNIGGNYYHVDAALQAEMGPYKTFMLNDDRFAESYFWDTERYPACTVDRLWDQLPAVDQPAEEEPSEAEPTPDPETGEDEKVPPLETDPEPEPEPDTEPEQPGEGTDEGAGGESNEGTSGESGEDADENTDGEPVDGSDGAEI